MSRRLVAFGAVAIIGVVGGGFAGYAVANRASSVSVITGPFYAGDHQASATVDGWSYGITGSVAWVDAGGSLHEAGWPDCLSPAGTTHTLRFGYVQVSGPAGQEWRQVVWVSCRT